jgi:hypothetical protein
MPLVAIDVLAYLAAKLVKAKLGGVMVSGEMAIHGCPGMISPGDVLSLQKRLDHGQTLGAVRMWLRVAGLYLATSPIGLPIEMREGVTPFRRHCRREC